MATARRVGGSMVWPISLRTSSTCTINLRMLAAMFSSLLRLRSAQAVPLVDVFGQQATDTGVHAVAGAHREDEHDLVGGWCAAHPHLDRIELAANVAGVDVGERHVERGAGR